MTPLRTLTRIALGAIMTFAGVSHLTFARQEFTAQVPDWFPIDTDVTVLASGAAERVEDALRGVVDDRAVEEVGMADRLAVEEQPFRIGEQTVVVHQVGKILGGVEELVGLHALRHLERDGPVGGDDFARCRLHESQSPGDGESVTRSK